MADEGVDRQIVERLRADGHEVAYVAEMSPGITDEVVLRESRNLSSVLITPDNDFGELVFRHGRRFAHPSAGLKPEVKASIVSAAIQERGQELTNSFGVLSPGNIRIRRKPHI